MIKNILSWLLYGVGNLLSKLLYFNWFTWLYPVYSRIMLMSSNLDTTDKVWKTANK